MRSRRYLYFPIIVAVLPLLVILQDPRIREPLHAVTLTLLKPFMTVGRATEGFILKSKDTAV
ncbi:MAG: hypothetical protein NC930_06045, partial [Candidatus Omnitrophica bacterium]|nr:hypothetical protein [Candidatus Omnitrophota bacterium]